MSVISAFNSAVSGLNAQATALSNISNNISNSSTVGYQSVDTDFSDMVLTNNGNTNLAQSLAGTTASSRVDVNTAGQIQTTGVSTDVAVDGGGYMVVNTNANSASGTYLATLAGSFRPDANGNLVNSAGYYLQGVPLDANGNAINNNSGSTLDSLSTVNVSNIASATSPTTTMTFAANLPSTETAAAATTPTPSSTSVTYYDALGQAQSLTMTFTPVQAASGAAQTNEWQMTVTDSAQAANGGVVGQATLNFGDSGSSTPGLLTGVNASTGTYDPNAGTLTVASGSGQNIAINIGELGSSGGMTQYASDYTTTNVQKNGASFGLLQSVSVETDGVVNANFSNGTSRPIYQLKLANVPNEEGLTPTNGDAYSFSAAAGVPTLDDPGTGAVGTTEGGALEGSNVNVTTELTNLIETQRAYSSSATVIQTGSQMLDVANHLSGG